MSSFIVTQEEQALASDPDAEVVLKGMLDLIESTGLHAATFYLNRTYGLKIWEDQTVEMYHIELPDESIDVEVVFIKNYLLRGYNNYATMGAYNDGGWVATSSRVYCSTGEYNLNSENLKFSFLMHEGLHFADLTDYPDLSSADLEYRAKLAEMMMLTDAHIYDALDQFVVNASDNDRAFSHPYANYHLVQDLSRIVFDSDYVGDMARWRSVPYTQLNAAAAQLYEQSREQLQRDPLVSEIL
ncbi:MAG: hypothetical protein ACI8S6_001247 [Myxococcota bacterium]